MTNLANYTQIAQLVKSWAEKVDAISAGRFPVDPRADLAELASDMHAFSNGLDAAVATFSGLLAGDNVAPSIKTAHVQLSDAATGEVLQRHVLSDAAFGWTIAFDVAGEGRMRVDVRYPHKYPPMVPEEV
jgi:hypothetical protein